MRSYFSHNVWTSSVCWNFILQNWMRHSVSHYFIYFSSPPIMIHVACLTRQFLNRWYAQGCLRAYQLGSHFCVCSIHCIIIINAAILPKAFSEHTDDNDIFFSFLLPWYLLFGFHHDINGIYTTFHGDYHAQTNPSSMQSLCVQVYE